MMGNCFDCMVNIDGLSNQQSCMVTVKDNMRIKQQAGVADVLLPDSHSKDTNHE